MTFMSPAGEMHGQSESGAEPSPNMVRGNKGGFIGPIPALMRSIDGERIVFRLSFSASSFPLSLAYIVITMVKHACFICPFSGETEELSRVQLIPDLADDADEMEVCCFTQGLYTSAHGYRWLASSGCGA